jgi:hypothetical protein
MMDFLKSWTIELSRSNVFIEAVYQSKEYSLQ